MQSLNQAVDRIRLVNTTVAVNQSDWVMLRLRRKFSTGGKCYPLIGELQKHPGNVAISFRPSAVAPPHLHGYTYSALNYHSARLAAALSKRGLAGPRKNVAVFCEPSFDFASMMLAIWQAGGCAVPLCFSHPVSELKYVCENAQVTSLLCLRTSPRTSDLSQAVSASTGAKLIQMDSIKPDDQPEAQPDRPDVDPDMEQPALMIYTSGTTGRPKGVITSYRALHAQTDALISSWEWQPSDHILNALPLHHVHGLINAFLCAVRTGARVTFMEKFNPEQVWQQWIDDESINVWMAVPTMYSKLIEAYHSFPPAKQTQCRKVCQRFRLMVSGSMALPEKVLKDWKEISGHTLLERYGMTEVGMALSNPLKEERRIGTVGKPLPGVICKVLDADGKPSSEGELRLKGPNLFTGYYNNPKATKESFDDDGFFLTGDIVSIDSDGYYSIKGRASVDILKTAGYKLSALEIEQIFLEHPGIAEIAVVGIPDPDYGQIVGAIIVPKKGSVLNQDEIKSWASSKMAKYKIPRKVLLVETIPRNAMGKVNKKELVKVFQ